MAGTLLDQATLAGTNDFVQKCKGELIKKALYLDLGQSGASTAERNLATAILNEPDGYATRIAVMIAFGNATVAANAPAVPPDADMAYVVNEAWPHLR